MKTDISFRDIAERLKGLALPEIQLVIGIAKGGIVPASLVAYKLGCDMMIMNARYRDENNAPLFAEPEISRVPLIPDNVNAILLVDDVSVSGKTMVSAAKMLTGRKVHTLAFKGKAEYVLFPEVEDCVNWPWSSR